jgi:hypothetical protein
MIIEGLLEALQIQLRRGDIAGASADYATYIVLEAIDAGDAGATDGAKGRLARE